MSHLIVQPVGHNLKERTTNGIRAYVVWDSLTKMDARERELVMKFVESLKNVTSCSWHQDRSTQEYQLVLERRIDLKWGGEQGVAQEVCRAIEEACGQTFVLQVGSA